MPHVYRIKAPRKPRIHGYQQLSCFRPNPLLVRSTRQASRSTQFPRVQDTGSLNGLLKAHAGVALRQPGFAQGSDVALHEQWVFARPGLPRNLK